MCAIQIIKREKLSKSKIEFKNSGLTADISGRLQGRYQLELLIKIIQMSFEYKSS